MANKLPFVITVLGIVGGVFIAMIFGINEDLFKNRIKTGLEQNQKIQAIEDPEAKESKTKAEAAKNWRYFQRYHFHATGIGAMSLGLILLLGFSAAPIKRRRIAAYLVAVGGFLYPFVWLFAALYGPSMGRHEAKEAFQLFAYGGGLFLIGSGWTAWLILTQPLSKEFGWAGE